MARTRTYTWWKVSDKLPPQKEIVKTKVEDENGKRNIANLYLEGNLWWMEDGSMYVYYTPTHWSQI